MLSNLTHPCRGLYVSVLLAALTVMLLPTGLPALDTLRPEQLKPGMKGYGLSVFSGTKLERFNVEIIGVMKNTFPKQDMILIRLSGANLERHKVIAGMSGSPIYIDGKLIGALAYGWTFENDPLAGVTPIHNMLAELDKPITPPARVAASFPLARPDISPANAQPQPLLTPLSLGGFTPRMISLLTEKLGPFGLLPIAAGGSSLPADKRPIGHIEPGGAFGVELIRGDLNAVGVGTVTYVSKNRVLAFGHPMFHAGSIRAPTVQAEVHTIMSSVQRSFKLATAHASAGALIGDWQSCIVADTQAAARMIPVTIEATNQDTGHRETYNIEILNNPNFGPLFAMVSILEAVSATSSSSEDTTVTTQLTIELADRTIRTENTYYQPAGPLLSGEELLPIAAVFRTPFGNPEIKSIHAHIQARLQRRTAEIKRAHFSRAEAGPGETVELTVTFKPFQKPEFTRTIPVTIPANTDSLRQLSLVIMAGKDAPADLAPPDSLDDYLAALPRGHKSTDLVVLMQSSGTGLQYQGRLLKNLPPSISAILEDSTNRRIQSAADTKQIVVPTDFILTGQTTVTLSIRQD
jgi:hypothetical protein